MKTNRGWMPEYCHPERFLPAIQESDVLFSSPPYYFPDFVGRMMTFLQGETARKLGFEYDGSCVLPCKWKCSDESLFQVDLTIFAYTGLYPFDKGGIGGFFNAPSLGASVHHGDLNLDFGGAHVGYVPGNGGDSFGHIWRPQEQAYSTNCGYVMNLLAPFQDLYEDACQNIQITMTSGEEPLISIPNEFIQPNWSSQNIKLLVDLDMLTAGEIRFQLDAPHTHTRIARSCFRLHPQFLEGLSPEDLKAKQGAQAAPIGRHLSPHYFTIFDTHAELSAQGIPKQRLLVYMKDIVAAQKAPPALKAGIISTNLEHNKLTDAVRAAAYAPYGFASITGVFIDLFDEVLGNYVNLFAPVALTVKPQGSTHQTDISPEELRQLLDPLAPAPLVVPLDEALALERGKQLVEQFTYRPGRYRLFEG